jgi:hypothetical protein
VLQGAKAASIIGHGHYYFGIIDTLQVRQVLLVCPAGMGTL